MYSWPQSGSAPQIDIKVGGSQLYAVQSYNAGSPVTTSDYLYILATCTQVQPSFSGTGFTCATQTGSPLSSPSVTFNWQMPNQEYSWSPAQPVDNIVDGYKIYRTSDNTVVASITGSQKSATSVTLNFTSLTDPNRNMGYYIFPVNSGGNPVGLDNSGNTTVGGARSTGTDITISCP
jgi:hypothetical protein